MKTHKVQDSRKPSERQTVENTEQITWRSSKQEVPDEVLHLNTTGVGKAKRKTRRGKRGGVKRKMQNLLREQRKLETDVGHLIKDIRHKIEASQSDHAPSRDVTVDVLASDVVEMSITPSDVEPLYDYEHYFPEEVTAAANNVIDKRVDVQELNTDPQNVCSYHSNNSTIAHGYGQMEMVSGYGNETVGYGYESIEYGHGVGYGYGHEYGYGNGNGYGNGHGYGNGNGYGNGYGNEAFGYGYGHGYGHGYEYGYEHRYGQSHGHGYGYGYECENQGYGYGYGYRA